MPLRGIESNGNDETQKERNLWWPNVDDEQLKTFLLTESLLNYKFSEIWRVLVFLGWKYVKKNDYSYLSPAKPFTWIHSSDGKLMYENSPLEEESKNESVENRLIFKSSRSIQEFLDGKEYTHPPSIQNIHKQGIPAKQIKCIREDVFRLIYIQSMREELKNIEDSIEVEKNDVFASTSPIMESSKNDNESPPYNDKEQENEQESKIQNKKRKPRQSSLMTSIEEGSERYFHRKMTKPKELESKPKNRRSHRLKGTNLISTRQFGIIEATEISNKDEKDHPDDDDDDDIQLQTWPSPQMNVDMVRNMPQNHAEEVKANYNKYKTFFSEWRHLLGTHHSLLFYGFGSKKQLLEEFAYEELQREGDVVVFDGYDREISISELMNVFIDAFLAGKDPLLEQNLKIGALPCLKMNPIHDFANLVVGVTPPSGTKCPIEIQRAIAISKRLSCRTRPIFIVLHNIDGPALRNYVSQESLAALTAYSCNGIESLRSIRLVASVDHVNAAAVLWDVKTSAKFSWIWKLVTTYHPYHEEVYFGGSHPVSKHQKDDTFLSQNTGIENILTSLAPRHAEVVQELAALQMDRIKNSDESVIPYRTLFKSCQQKMFISSDMGLRNVLRELEDHKIVEFQQEDEGEMISILHGPETLKTIIDFRR